MGLTGWHYLDIEDAWEETVSAFEVFLREVEEENERCEEECVFIRELKERAEDMLKSLRSILPPDFLAGLEGERQEYERQEGLWDGQSL